jgi:hypothetical protein
MTSASGPDWSDTPSGSVFHTLSNVVLLSHTCSISLALQVYTLTIIIYIASIVIVPKTSVYMMSCFVCVRPFVRVLP